MISGIAAMILSVVSLCERKTNNSAEVYISFINGTVALFHSGDLNVKVLEMVANAVRLSPHGYSFAHEALLNCLSMAIMEALTNWMNAALEAKFVPGASMGRGWFRQMNRSPCTTLFHTMRDVLPSTVNRIATCSG